MLRISPSPLTAYSCFQLPVADSGWVLLWHAHKAGHHLGWEHHSACYSCSRHTNILALRLTEHEFCQQKVQIVLGIVNSKISSLIS